MAVCNSCGAEFPEESKFCTHCGTPVTTESSTDLLTCSSCGLENKPGSKFCVKCGSALNKPIVRPVQNKQSNIHICKECGTHNLAGDKFCVACGAALQHVEIMSDPPRDNGGRIMKPGDDPVIKQAYLVGLLVSGISALIIMYYFSMPIYDPTGTLSQMQQYTGMEITNPAQGSYTLQLMLHGGFFLAQFYAYLQYQKGEMAIPYKVSLWIIIWGGLYGFWVVFITLSSIQGQPADIVMNNVLLIAGHVYLVMMMLKARRAMANEQVG